MARSGKHAAHHERWQRVITLTRALRLFAGALHIWLSLAALTACRGTEPPQPSPTIPGRKSENAARDATVTAKPPRSSHRAPAAVASAPPLFVAHPGLATAVPYMKLGTLPTPVEHVVELGRAIGLKDLYIKRDDRAGNPIGGSKVRKLEFLLADAKRQRKDTVMTFGGFGSNHALATAVYAQKVGLHAILLLLPEPNSAHVRHNLLGELKVGAEVRLSSNGALDRIMARAKKGRMRADEPYVIAPGGSSPLGNVGYLNAAWELRRQIDEGVMPRPDFVYIAMGTMGSSVGLILGLKAAGLPTKVRCVRASTTKYASETKLAAMIKVTNEYLRSLDPSFPDIMLEKDDGVIVHGYVGRGYAQPTRKGDKAIEVVRKHAKVELDRTYTGKAFAALIDDVPELQGKIVLFWNTFDGREIDVSDVSFRDLPRGFHGYFAGHPRD